MRPRVPTPVLLPKEKKGRKGGREKEHTVMPGNWFCYEDLSKSSFTSLAVGCHLNVAIGPAIIPFTVLDSGIVRSCRRKGRASGHFASFLSH
jgi:hypothetical protein